MRLICYEFRKIAGIKILWFILGLLFLANCVLSVITAKQAAGNILPDEYAEIIFNAYREDPDKVLADWQNYNEQITEYERLQIEADMNGVVLDRIPAAQNIYSKSEEYPDSRLYSELMSSVGVMGYRQQIEKLIDASKATLTRYDKMNIAPDSYQYRYQQKIIKHYTALADKVEVEPDYVRGWDIYFSYDSISIFVFTAILTVSGVFFTHDKDIGFYRIIRSTKKGRRETAVAKLGASVFFCVGTVTVFSLASFIIIGAFVGYSSVRVAIQTLPDYIYCPLAMTVGQYALFNIVIRSIAAIMLSALVMALSVVLNRYSKTYIASAALMVINYVLYTAKYLGTSNPLQYLNIFSATAPDTLALRYTAVNLFGYAADLTSVILLLFPVLAALTIGGIIIFYQNNVFSDRSSKAVRISMTSVLNRVINNKKANISTRKYFHGIVGWEIYKTILSPGALLTVVALLLINIYAYAQHYNVIKTYTDTAYQQYMEVLEGPLDNSKKEYISHERRYIDSVLQKKSYMDAAIKADEISMEEYIDYLSRYNYATGHSEALSMVESQANHLDKLVSEKKIDGWFLYDTGWNTLFSGGANLCFLAAIILVFVGCFSHERNSTASQGNFAQILRPSKNGRSRTFIAKVLSCIIISSVLSVIFIFTDFITAAYSYDLPAIYAPLASLRMFSATDTAVTIWQYLLFSSVIKVSAAIMISLLICGFSELIRKDFATIIVVLVILLFPSVLAGLGFDKLQKLDFLQYLNGTPLYLTSSELNMLGNDCTGLFLYALVALAVTSLVLQRAKSSWIK